MGVTVNCDMGEGFGPYRLGDDEALMACIDVANLACGFHASDPTIMAATVRLAKAHKVAVGAHPSLPDRQGFGRREMALGREELCAHLVYQVGALKGFLEAEGMTLNHIKPHGALYGMAARDEAVAHAVADAAEIFGVPLMGLAGTLHESVYEARGIHFIAEFFADLEYDSDGNLIITREHERVEPRAAAARVTRALTEGLVGSAEGADVAVRADTICVHSDTPGAVEIAKSVRKAVATFAAVERAVSSGGF